MGLLLSFIPLLIIISLSLGFVILTKRKFGTIFPLTLFFICFSMFLSQLIFNTFYVAYGVSIAGGLASIAYATIIAFTNKRKFKQIRENYFTAGFFVNLIAYVFFVGIFYFTNFLAWDNFSHWGPMVKEMLRFDKFYTIPEAGVPFHKDYPPIVSLFELFFVKFTGYKEGVTIIANHVLQFAVLLPIIEHIKKQKIAKGLAIFFIAIMATLFVDAHQIFNSIYNDYLIAFYGAFSLYIAIFADLNKFNLFYLLSTVLFLSYIKEIAIVLAGIIAIALLVRNFQQYGRKHFFRHFITPVIICIISLLGFFSWKFIIRDVESERQFDLSKAAGQSITCPITLSCEEDYRNVTALNFYKAVPSQKISDSWISLSYVQLIILTVLIYTLIYRSTKRKAEDKKRLVLILVSYLAGAVLYAGAMFFIYTSLFGDLEGPKLASFNRYMNTYILIGLILAIYYYATVILEKASFDLLILCFICILVQSPSGLAKLLPNPTSYSESKYAQNLSQSLSEGETVIVYYHDITKYNYFRYFATSNYKQIIAIPIRSTPETLATEIQNTNQRYMFIDLTKDDIKTFNEILGRNFVNGKLYSN